MQLAFRNLPSTLRPPGTYAEVQSGNTQSGQIDRKGLIVGQLTASGARTTTAATSAATTANDTNNTLTHASAAVIQNVVPGPYCWAIDRTAPSAIPIGTYVVAKASGTVTLSAPVADDVGSGDSIEYVDVSPVWMNSQVNASGLFGQGSQAARMYATMRKNDPFGEWWMQPLPDDVAAVKATGTLALVGTGTATGVLNLYIDATPIPVVCTSGMTAAQLATAAAAAVNANGNLPVTASPSTGTLTFTAKNAGQAGNDIDIRLNLYGPQNNEYTPAGIVAVPGSAPVSMTSGATNPYAAMTLLLAQLPDFYWGAIAAPYTDTNSLNALQTYMGDVNGQWAWLKMKYGAVFTTQRTSLGNLQTNGLARNDPHVTLMGNTNSPTTCEEWAAALAGGYLQLQRATPGSSSNGMPLYGVVAPVNADRFHLSDQDALLHSGISTYKVDQDGTVRVQKLITTYQVDSFADPDDTFLQVDDMFRIAYALSYMKVKLDFFCDGALLAEDGTRFGPFTRVVTPKIAKAYLLGLYGDLVLQAIVQDPDGFAAGLVVRINPQNKKRLDVLWPGILVNDLDIIAILAQPVT